jgi:site-specific recombinase XerD
MSDVLDRFCADYHSYNDISADRRTMQRRVLTEFAATLPEGVDLCTAGANELRDYLASLIADGLKPSTIRRILGAIRPFYKWAWQRGLVTADVLMQIRDVEAPRGGRNGKPRPYTAKEMRQFWLDLDAALPFVDEKWLRRYFNGSSPWRRVQSHARRLQLEAIVALALYGGLRRDEIWRLSIDDMHYENEYVVVTGARKNAEAEALKRAVPMIEPLRNAIQAWLDFREQLAPTNDAPWLSLWRKHALKPAQKRTFNLALGRIGPGYSLHRLRHTAATEMLRAGYELEAVQKILGHSRIQQTLEYAELLDEDVLAAAKRSGNRFAQNMARARAAA